MTIHINNPALEKELEIFAKETNQSIDELASNFLKQEIELYKNNPAHVVQTFSRWGEYEKSGSFVSQKEVTQYVESLKVK